MKPKRNQSLRLRAPEAEDIDFIYRLENDQRIWVLSNTQAPVSRFAIEQYILSASQDIYATRQIRMILEKKGRQGAVPIGMVDLFDFDPQHLRAGIGILLDDRHRQKGFGSDALRLMIDYAFGTLHLRQLYCHIGAGNLASKRLFDRMGFTQSGRLTDWIRTAEGWEDVVVMQLVNF